MERNSPSVFPFLCGGAGLGLTATTVMFVSAEQRTTDPQGLGPGVAAFLFIMPLLIIAGVVSGYLIWAVVIPIDESEPEIRRPAPGDTAIVCKGKFTGKAVVIVDVDESAETAKVQFEGKTKTVVGVLPLNAIEVVE